MGCTNILERSLSFQHEEDEEASFFCYTHGLSGYEGNCQRPFHGHRSKIVIYQNDRRRKALENDKKTETINQYKETLSNAAENYEKTVSKNYEIYDLPGESGENKG